MYIIIEGHNSDNDTHYKGYDKKEAKKVVNAYLENHYDCAIFVTLDHKDVAKFLRDLGVRYIGHHPRRGEYPETIIRDDDGKVYEVVGLRCVRRES